MKIRSLGAERTDRQTDRHNEDSISFLQFCERI